MALHHHTPRQRAAVARGSGPTLPGKRRRASAPAAEPSAARVDTDAVAEIIVAQVEAGISFADVGKLLGMSTKQVKKIYETATQRNLTND